MEHHRLIIGWMTRIEEIYARSTTLWISKLIVRFLLFWMLGINIVQVLCLIRLLLSTRWSLPLIILNKFVIIVRAKVIHIWLLSSTHRIRRLIIVEEVSRSLSRVLHSINNLKSQIRKGLHRLCLIWILLCRIVDSALSGLAPIFVGKLMQVSLTFLRYSFFSKMN